MRSCCAASPCIVDIHHARIYQAYIMIWTWYRPPCFVAYVMSTTVEGNRDGSITSFELRLTGNLPMEVGYSRLQAIANEKTNDRLS